jgi:Cys-rich four helix bundle protein (predicted Tat secretion target)
MAAMSAAALAQQDHSHHHGPAANKDGGSGPNKALVDAATECLVTSQACLAHCIVLLGQGNKEMAACAQTVSQVMAICGALQSLALQQAPLLKAIAKVSLDACEVCEKECRKHESHHVECKECADSCAKCAKQCKALLA